VGSAISSILREAASRGPSASADILVYLFYIVTMSLFCTVSATCVGFFSKLLFR